MDTIDIDGVLCCIYPDELFENCEHYGFIYVTHDLTNDKYYVGKYTCRKYSQGWAYYFGSSAKLRQAIAAHGADNFKRKIIDFAESDEKLRQIERQWVAYFGARDKKNWYNIA